MPEQLSDDEVARFVAGWWGGRATVPVLLGAGEWSRAWALRLDGRAVVVRFGQHRDDFDRDALVGRLAPVGVPVPRVLEVGAAPRGWFAVSATSAEALLSVEQDEPRLGDWRAALSVSGIGTRSFEAGTRC